MATQALLIIDAQVTFFSSNSKKVLSNGEKVLHNIDLLLEKARDANIPIFFIQHTDNNDPDFTEHSSGWQIHPEIAPNKSEPVIQASHWDAFHDTSLLSALQKKGISKLLIVGFQTEICIDSTCRRAHELGYEVVLVKDAHSTYDSPLLKAEQIIAHHNHVLSSLVDLASTKELAL